MIYYYHHNTYTLEIMESDNKITNISLHAHITNKQNDETTIEIPSSIKQTINWFDKYAANKFTFETLCLHSNNLYSLIYKSLHLLYL